MSISSNRVCVIAAVALASLLAGSTTARALVLDWNSATWSNAGMNQSGVVANSFDLSPLPDGVNDITVTLTPASNVWNADPTTGTQTPAITGTMTGGVPGQQSLNLAADLHTNSRLTVQISFTGPQSGADNVSFTLFDIDLTADRDVINNIYGLAPDGTHIAPTITNLGLSVDLTGTVLTQTLTSIVASPNNSS